MRSLREYYRTKSKREKALLWIVASAAVFVLFYYSDAFTVFSSREEEDELQEKVLLLRKLQGLLSRQKIIKAEASSGAEPGSGIRLIKTTSEAQVLAELPRLLKKISAQSNLVLTKSEITQKEALCNEPLLLRLGMTLEIESIPKAERLQQFLYQLENSDEFTCYVKELRLKELAGGAKGVNLTANVDTFALIER